MAKHLNTYPLRYPWDLWLDKASNGGVTLKKGRDFPCQPHSMSIQIRRAAAARQMTIHVEIDGDTIRVQEAA